MRWFASIAVALALVTGCASGSRSEWRRIDGRPDDEAMRKQRAVDLAECATLVGAPTPGVQSTSGPSRGQFEDCMRSRGWRRVPVSSD